MGVDRREFLKAAAVGAGGLAGAASGALPGGVWSRLASAQSAEAGPVRVYLIVVDGLRPEEVALMPQLSELAASGTFYPASRAHMVAETTPNHLSMITGMRSDRHGMPGNDVPFLEDNIGLEPRYLQADTIFSLARRQAPDLVTAAVTSKTYIVAMSKHDRDGDSMEDATSTNNPTIVIPGFDFTPDAEIAAQGIMVSRELDPDFLFLSLGDVDRVGHVDETGGLSNGMAPAGRLATIQNTDNLIRQLVNVLKADGRFASTVLIVTADHSMDWSFRNRTVSLAAGIAADPSLADEFTLALNGGAALYALRQPAAEGAQRQLRALRGVALATDGVEEALYIRPNPEDGGEEHWVGRVHPDWGLTGDRTGDLIVTVQDGFRIINDSQFDNPIPGNHGHTVTLPIPLIVSGGWPGIRKQRVEPPAELGPSDRDPAQAENIDTGPTAAWLLGLGPPPGGFDGRVLEEAFTERPPSPVTVREVASVPLFERSAGPNRLITAIALSQRAFPSDAEGNTAAEALVVASAGQFPDAIAATPLAVTLGAPLLITPLAGLGVEVAAEVRRLGPSSAVVVGGTDVVSDQVIEDLADAGIPRAGIRRVGGADRYETSRLIAREVAGLGPDSGGEGDPEEGTGGEESTFAGEAVLALGDTPPGGGFADAFADALVAGPGAGRKGRPVLLTAPDQLPEPTALAIEELGITRLTITGGSEALDPLIEEVLQRRGIRTERIGGRNRYATGVAITERAIREAALTDVLFLVSGADFPDALAAGAALGVVGGILLLVPPDKLDDEPEVVDFLQRRADGLVRVVFVGGVEALTPRLESDVRRIITEHRTRTS